MKIVETTILLRLFSFTIVDAFTGSSSRWYGQNNVAFTLLATEISRIEDLRLTRQLIMNHQKIGSKTVSTEQYIQQMENPSSKKKKEEVMKKKKKIKKDEIFATMSSKSSSSFFDSKVAELTDQIEQSSTNKEKEKKAEKRKMKKERKKKKKKRKSELIERTKRLFDPDIRLGLADGGDCLAEKFQFCAAVVGPIGKKPFLEALSGFKLEDSFDIEQNRFGFTVSPVQPNRVYFLTSNTAQMKKDFMGVAPENAINDGNLILPPECHHADFDDNMKVTEYGFYTVDRQYGNTGGLGGAFGFFYGVGKSLPFREARPFKKSLKYSFLSWIGNRMSSRKKKN